MINNSALFEVELRQGLIQLGLILDEAQILQTLNFAHEFLRWNQVHNLSAIESEELFLSTHLLDSLSVVRPLKDAVISGLLPKEPLIADLGAGGGFPSILLAIALPTVQFVLLGSFKSE
jgi:16S rRNA (guanine527-N7)-methyltransferase